MSRTLIVGDVHGCPGPLERLLRKARPDRVVLTGDVFTRGPDPGGVWDLVRAWDMEAVLGNQDEKVLRSWRQGKALPRRAFRWLERLPLVLITSSVMVVHAGVHPRKPRRTSRCQALHMRTWHGEPWWKRYRGRHLVVHGHAARDGLIDRRPYTLGLDTGCAGGGRLTGYLVEKDRLVSVKGLRLVA